MRYHPAFPQFVPPPPDNKTITSSPLYIHLVSLLVGNKRNFLNNRRNTFFGVHSPFTVDQERKTNIGAPLICYLDYNSLTWSSNRIFRSTHFPQHPLATPVQDQFHQKLAVAGRLISKMARSLRQVKILRSCHHGRRCDHQ